MFTDIFRFAACLAVALVFSAPLQASENQQRILMMGDSLLASNRNGNRAVSNFLAEALPVSVTDKSVVGAKVIHHLPITGLVGFSIKQQYRKGDWDWVVLNGGGNDLLFGCGCHFCNRKIDRLVSRSGQRGEIPNLIRKLRQTGARVIYVGYLRSPGLGSPIESCKDEGDELESRINAFAETDAGVHFLSLTEMVPHGDRSYHGLDMIHPSAKASREIALRVARLIAQ